jgi:hypothetical protein
MKQHLQKIAARAASGLRGLRALAISWRPDALMAFGAGGIAYGAWLVYQPAGFIVGGAFVLTAGVLAARKAA